MAVFQTRRRQSGNVYAHLSDARLYAPTRRIGASGVPGNCRMTLPLGIAKGFDTPPDHGVTMLWLVALFFASIGPPFIVLAASAPLLQSWFISTGHPHAANPYAPTRRPISALLPGCSPQVPIFRSEPTFPLCNLNPPFWTAGFCALIPLYAFAAAAVSAEKFGASHPETAHAARPSAMQCLSWTVLAAVPSALALRLPRTSAPIPRRRPVSFGATVGALFAHLRTVFRDRPWVNHATVLRLLPYAVAPLAVSAF